MTGNEIESETSHKKFLEWANKTDLIWVMLGGLAGGLLMPFVKSFLDNQASLNTELAGPSNMVTWAFGALFGLICAGIVVYTLGYDANRNRRQTFFVALLAGLTFPTVLANLTQHKGAETLDNSKENIEIVEELADNLTLAKATEEQADEVTDDEIERVTETGASLLKSAIDDVPSDTLDKESKKSFERQTDQAITKIAQNAQSADAQTRAKAGIQLKEVVETAKKRGYDDIGKSQDVQRIIKEGQNAEPDR